jgi:4-hydroxy-3-polyprenylbenzoate decarboxylase
MLERVDWRRDLHFQTRTTIDTLDYSGTGFNEGSKVIIAAAGPAVRSLPMELPAELPTLPHGFSNLRLVAPGILAIQSPRFTDVRSDQSLRALANSFSPEDSINRFPLVVLVDDSEFVSRNFANWLWVTFTRSNPAVDIDGIGAETVDKHWGCRGSLLIDARIKPHHAPPLVEDPRVSAMVDARASRGGPLSRYL